MEYDFRSIEKKWQKEWDTHDAYKVRNDSQKPKFYVLDMFPYPSGAGLHVGHPLGYIASDIFARYKRLKGFNVLHPMGFDAFGLPAEQYAIERGIHPVTSTEQNINNFRSQLDNIGFCFDWSREVRTSDPAYYKWTQWIFLQIFESWYNPEKNKAEPITELVRIFEDKGNAGHPIPNSQFQIPGNNENTFTPVQWKAFDEKVKRGILMNYRLAYLDYAEVWWCAALGTVLANDEVVNGVSERGGHPVVKKKMRQWFLRITEYADRLLQGLEQIEFTESLKEQQKNWIGRSEGAEIKFSLASEPRFQLNSGTTRFPEQEESAVDIITVYTTRPDTIFGVDFIVLAPEHELVEKITTSSQKEAIEKYLAYVNSRSDRERMAEVKQITGCFTGAFALNPLDGREIPIWIAEYVLAGYGTGAIMGVPCGDQRDFNFANHFNISITNIIGEHFNGHEANPTKDALLQHSGFINGMRMKDAIEVVINKLEEMGVGKRQVNYKMRDAGFSRQRYWGEPFPIVYKNDVPYTINDLAVDLSTEVQKLPVELPYVESYGPGPEGEGPLANLPEWYSVSSASGDIEMRRETNTMPGYAGSSWYFFRYMDPHNDNAFCDRKVSDYWGQVDLYIGGTEHAVGHLLYSRLWTKILFDLGFIGHEEPYKKLVNQGMITGVSQVIHRLSSLDGGESKSDSIKHGDQEYSLDKKRSIYHSVDYMFTNNIYHEVRIPIQYVDNNKVNISLLTKYNTDFKESVFVCSNGYYLNGVFFYFDSQITNGPANFLSASLVEKMSKTKLNTENPDDLVNKYGADTFRMYEMFLGPIDQSKPWDTKGIEGVHRFLKKFWRLFADETKGMIVTDEAATDAEMKVLHKTIKKVEEDTERFSFNTAVSTFMIAVNELTDLKSHKRSVLDPLLILLTPYAPHICEELWSLLKSPATETGFILDATYPILQEKYLIESTKEYPVSVNGKLRTTMNIALDAQQPEVEKMVLANEIIQKWIEGKSPKKIIFVKGKMVNIVI